MTHTYTGKCLCGAVTFAANGPPVIVAQCHCDECRRLSGTGHTVGAMFALDAVTISGPLNEYRYASAKGSDVTKAFCGTCGSPIFGRNTKAAGHITLPLGTFDDASGLDVAVVIFDRDRPHWDHLGTHVVTFATQPDWTPDS